MTSRRQASLEFRNEVILAMHEAGLHQAVTPAGTSHTNSPVKGNGGSVSGLSWALVTRREQAPDLSEGLNRSAALATETGRDRSAALFHRRGYPVEQAFAVMTIETLIDVIKQQNSVTASVTGSEEQT
jgi:hypothetical protein